MYIFDSGDERVNYDTKIRTIQFMTYYGPGLLNISENIYVCM